MNKPEIKIKVESKTIDLLVEKLSSAAGVVWEPFQMKQMAEAEVAAAIIKAEGQLQLDDIQKRAAQRIIREETIKQINIENIANQSLPYLNSGVNPLTLEDDWLLNFTDKCKSISNEEMQEMWAKILAGEINEPGKFSKKTINILQSMDKNDAERFKSLSSFVIMSGNEKIPFIYNYNSSLYSNNGINFEALAHLDFIGLIRLSSNPFHYGYEDDEETQLTYFNTVITLKINKGDELALSMAMFTQAGNELHEILEAVEIKDLPKHIVEYLEDNHIVIKGVIKGD